MEPAPKAARQQKSQANKAAAAAVFILANVGGPGGIRTLDLSDANRTLSQLSYRPMTLTQIL